MVAEWAREVVDAPDLREMGCILLAQLRRYAGEPTPDRDSLAARLAFERMVHGLLSRANERGLSPIEIDPDLPVLMRDFVVANASLERQSERLLERRGYERGRSEALAAVADGLIHPGREQVALLERDRRVPIASAQPAGREEAREEAGGFIRLAERRRQKAREVTQEDAQKDANKDAFTDSRLDVHEHAQDGEQSGARDGERGGTQAVLAAPGQARRIEALGADPAIAQPGTDCASAPEREPVRTGAAPDEAAEVAALPAVDVGDARRPSSATIAALREHFDIDAELIAPGSKPIALSQALEAFLTEMRKIKGDDRARADVAPVIGFMIDLVGDIALDQFREGQRRRVDEALVEIPFPAGFPGCRKMTLHQRYLHAQEQGWEKLRRAAEGTVKNRYHAALHRFFGWLKKRKLLVGDRPKFSHTSRELMSELPRDAFRDEELIALVSLPLFTGCQNPVRIWTPGNVLCRNGLYWSYLILILTGMRPGEVGQIRLDQIKTDGEFYYFDLRPFDAAKGRVPIGDLMQLKTGSSARVVPIHPLLVDLGLIDYAHALNERGETRLLPDLNPYVKSTDEVRWSQPITKSWQYVKKNKLKNERADLSLYGTRHLMAAWLDASKVAERSRDRILGHALSDPRRRYGRNGALDPTEARIIAAIEPPVVASMRAILTGALARAKSSELRIVKPRHRTPAAERRT